MKATHWMFLCGWYMAFRLTAAIDLLSQPFDILSIQPSLLYFLKFECPNDLIYLSSDSSKGEISNVLLLLPIANTLVTNSSCEELSNLVFTPINSSIQSSFSWPHFHPTTRKYPSIIQSLRCLASIPRSKNKLASLDYDKIAYHMVQYLPPLFNGNVLFKLPPSCVSTSTSKNTIGQHGLAVQWSRMVSYHNLQYSQQSRFQFQEVILYWLVGF